MTAIRSPHTSSRCVDDAFRESGAFRFHISSAPLPKIATWLAGRLAGEGKQNIRTPLNAPNVLMSRALYSLYPRPSYGRCVYTIRNIFFYEPLNCGHFISLFPVFVVVFVNRPLLYLHSVWSTTERLAAGIKLSPVIEEWCTLDTIYWHFVGH